MIVNQKQLMDAASYAVNPEKERKPVKQKTENGTVVVV